MGSSKLRLNFFNQAKQNKEKVTSITSYDALTARIFDEAGVDVLLIGDSAANTVFGRPYTSSITVDEMIPMVRAVSESAKRAFVIADMPFGSYEQSPELAIHNAVRFIKEGGAQGVKLEGGCQLAPTIRALTNVGINVCGHIGFTPQTVDRLGGFLVQGKNSESATVIKKDACAVEAAGAFAVVMELVPESLASEITNTLKIPTIGIGAGAGCDGQILVWQDAMGLSAGRGFKFVKKYANLYEVMLNATQEYVRDVKSGSFPESKHCF